jgi:hypothetical protein
MNDHQPSSFLAFVANTSINLVLHLLRLFHHFLWLGLSHQKFLLTQIQVTPILRKKKDIKKKNLGIKTKLQIKVQL